MRRREFVLSSGTVAAVSLTGCVGSGQETNSGTPHGDSTRSISISESGEKATDPDLAVFQASIEATGDDPSRVRNELSDRSDELYDGLVESGIDEDNITTSRFDISERIDRRRLEEEGIDPRSEEAQEEYTYYEGTHSFTVEVENVENVGQVVDTAVDAGADDIGRIQFTLSDEKREELREEAMKEAIDNARTEAEFIASEVDATVVEATKIDTSGGGVTPIREEAEMYEPVPEDGAEPTTELHPDDVTVDATVNIEYKVTSSPS